MKCAAHPNVDTGLACGKCGKPICPKCLVHTPVGARCKDCAGLKRLPTYQVATTQHLRAALVGLALALALGIAWGWLRALVPYFGLFGIFVAAGAGYLIGEAISRSVNRRRGTILQVIVGISFVLTYAVSNMEYSSESGLAFYFSPYGILALVVGVVVAVGRLR
jgi:hypothetical protein